MTTGSHAAGQDVIERYLEQWELPPECEMRADHAADAALARVASAREPADDLDLLLAPQLLPEPGEPSAESRTVDPRSRVESVARNSSVLPISTVPSTQQGATSSRTRAIWSAFGLAAAAAALLLWIRPSKTDTEPVSSPPLAGSVAPATVTSEVAESNVQEMAVAAASDTAERADSPIAETPGLSPTPTNSLARKPKRSTLAQASKSAPAPPLEADSPSPRMQPAAQGQNVPDHPSTGEIQASLAKVMPTAQRCLPSNHQPVSVRLTFASDGRVSRVSPATNGLAPSDATCIKAALRQARVSPFGRLSYAVTSTLRPAR